MVYAANLIWAPADTRPAFGQRLSSASISINGGNDALITNLFFNQFVGGAGGEYIELDSFVNVTITDCDFDTVPDSLGSGRRCIYLVDCTGVLTITRCRARLIPQNFIQLNRTHMSGNICDNRMRGTTVNSEDCISLFKSGGVDATHRLAVWNNRLDGNVPNTLAPGYTSGSGSGMLLCDSAQDSGTGYIDCYNNSVLNPGAIGIGVAGGTDINVNGNLIYGIQTATSNVGMYTWNPGSSLICSVIEARQNRVKWTNSAGSDNGYFDTGNCGTITNVADNNFSDATVNPLTLAVNLK